MQCLSGPCSPSLTACPVGDGGTSCVDLTTGKPFCGACGVVCGPNQVCAAGQCQSYLPATPCSACPCTSVCDQRVGAPSSCCPGIGGGAQPICVAGSACP
jgi:hypothetical protein